MKIVQCVMFLFAYGIIVLSCECVKKTADKKTNATTIALTPKDTSIKKPKTDSLAARKPKAYKDVITTRAITDEGLFKVHKIDERYFFEIPDSLLGRDILIVSRIMKAPAGPRPNQGFYGYSGDEIGSRVVRLEKGPNYKLFLKEMNFSEKATDSSGGMYQSLMRSNLQPIVTVFDIKTFSPDSSGVVVDWTDFIAGDNNILFFENKALFGVGGIQPDKCYIDGVKSFPINVEISTVKTYAGGDAATGPVIKTFELNSSIVLLPKDPMKSRDRDDRVGYFADGYYDFDAKSGGGEPVYFIKRWRLEPKDEDKEKYLRGDLVEPKKPIVFYIDPTTPKKWVPYLIQGVNDWQKAFEKAGFKNAIYALEAPKDDSDWNLYDARHSAIVYKPSAVTNAYGPNISDPRTGEILESHIGWFHNITELLQKWYFIQAAPNDPKARKMEFDDSLMGQLIRFASSHEVGHTLGLLHNFGSSSTVPVDSLRSKTYLDKYGHTPSIMDYARFNYVAQPQDNIPEQDLFPRIGMYDEWAIEWGYRWFPENKFANKEAEQTFFNQWVIRKLQEDKRYWYGEQYLQSVNDPRKQSEDLGDNAMKAGYYGIQNLKRIVPKLLDWTKRPNAHYEDLKGMSVEVVNQYTRYINHVVNNIGKFNWAERSVEEKGNVIDFPSKEKQRQAVQFLNDQLFATPQWLMNKEIFSKCGMLNPYTIWGIQVAVLRQLISYQTFNNLAYFQYRYPKQANTFDELMNDLKSGIWSELSSARPIDFNRRFIQKFYSDRLAEFLNPLSMRNPAEGILTGYNIFYSDMSSLMQNQVNQLVKDIDKALPHYKEGESKDHLLIIRQRLKKALEDNEKIKTATSAPATQANAFSLFGEELNKSNKEKPVNPCHLDCWSDQSLFEQ